MTDGLVQQDTRPARSQHHGHGSGRSGNGLQVDQRLPHRFPRVPQGAIPVEEPTVADSAAATGTALLAAAVVFDDHAHVQPHQRSHVAGQCAIAAGDQDRVPHGGQADHDLGHARVLTTRLGVHRFQ